MNQLKISFHQLLSKMNKEKKSPIYCTVTHKSNLKPVKLSTDIWLQKGDWDKKQKKVKSKYLRATALNLQLSKMEQKILTIYDDLKKTHEYPSLEMLKVLFRNKGQQKNTLLTLYDAFIINIEKRKGSDYAPGTIRHYNSNRNRMNQYLKEIYFCSDMPIAQLNLEFISNFEIFLNNRFGNGLNHICKQAQRLKTIIRFGFPSMVNSTYIEVSFKYLLKVESASLSQPPAKTTLIKHRRYHACHLHHMPAMILMSTKIKS